VRRRACLWWAAVCAALVLAWWFLTVRFNYGGNWTALYCTGDRWSVPPALASEKVYVFAGSHGFDGQFYHYIAHDPLLRQGLWKHIDAPRYRYRRILLPGLAYLAATGQARWIDAAYRLVTLGFVFLGAYWLGRHTDRHLGQPAWGLAFALAPAVLVSIDRLTVDVALAALCVGYLYYARAGPSWERYTVLVAAGLSRETGLLLVAACCGAALLRREWVRAAVFSTAALPALAWYLYVEAQAPAGASVSLSWIPFSGLLDRLLHPPSYPLAGPVLWLAHGLDYLAVAAVWLALALVARLAFRQKPGPLEMSALLFALLALGLGPGDAWESVFSFGRTLTPLLLLLALEGLALGSWLALLPAAMVGPRILLQLAPQALGILRGLAGLA